MVSTHKRIFASSGTQTSIEDIVTPYTAYGFTKMVSGYTGPACTVIRTSDLQTQEIGWDGDVIDHNTLQGFLNPLSTGRVYTLHNQGIGGTTYDLVENNSLKNPQIRSNEFGGRLPIAVSGDGIEVYHLENRNYDQIPWRITGPLSFCSWMAIDDGGLYQVSRGDVHAPLLCGSATTYVRARIKYNSAFENWEYHAMVKDNQGTSRNVSATGDIEDYVTGQWIFACGTYDTSGNIQFYVNGQFTNENRGELDGTVRELLRLYYPYRLKGSTDGLIIANETWTAEQVYDLYQVQKSYYIA